MLKPYRRHLKECTFAGKKKTPNNKCKCPVWCNGTLPQESGRVRCSLNTGDWQAACKRISEMEVAGEIPKDMRVLVTTAIESFMEDCKARGLVRDTLKKYDVVLFQMEQFAKQVGITYVHEFDPPLCRTFRASWADAPLSASKKLERFKAFWNFIVSQDWVLVSPAKDIKPPLVGDSETQPFTREEMDSILKNCWKMQENRRVRALVLLLRYSGLRIGDAVSLSKDRIDANGMLSLYTAKSGTLVRLPLPPFVTNALYEFEHVSERYFFWTGGANKGTPTGNFRRTLRKLFKRAGIAGHAHRFRDTFAVELLIAGATLEEVSKLLGHRSVKVTEKHYAAWVRLRQDRAEQAVRASWVEVIDGGVPVMARKVAK